MITKINFKNFANLKEVDEENLRIREKELENMRIDVILEVVLRVFIENSLLGLKCKKKL